MDRDEIFMRHKLCPIFFLADGSHEYPECRCGECLNGCEEAHEELGGVCWCHMDRIKFRIKFDATAELLPGQPTPPAEFMEAALEAWSIIGAEHNALADAQTVRNALDGSCH